MRGLDRDAARAEEVLAGSRSSAITRSLVMACSFQKEESVLIDMLMAIEPCARVFTIDTGVLFPETYEVWRKVEDRYGLHVEVFDATPHERHSVERAELLRPAARSTRSTQALDGADAWITGIRREQSPTRAERPEGGVGRAARRVEVQPARGLDRGDVWTLRARARPPLPSRCTTGATTRSAAPPAPCPATAATAAGRGRTRRSAGCTCEHRFDAPVAQRPLVSGATKT